MVFGLGTAGTWVTETEGIGGAFLGGLPGRARGLLWASERQFARGERKKKISQRRPGTVYVTGRSPQQLPSCRCLDAVLPALHPCPCTCLCDVIIHGWQAAGSACSSMLARYCIYMTRVALKRKGRALLDAYFRMLQTQGKGGAQARGRSRRV